MPPKTKETKKSPTSAHRPNISNSSLNYVPNDAVEGYQERIETGIDFTPIEEAARRHKQKCFKENIPQITFKEALQNKIKNSILNGFLQDDSNLKEQWEVYLQMTLWDNEKFANEEGKICFNNLNCITDDLVKMIKKAVNLNDRQVLKRELKLVNVLRVTNSKMTKLDTSLREFYKLITLNLCGNYLSEIDCSVLPEGLRMLELQANHIRDILSFAEYLPSNLIYLGLSRNVLDNASILGISKINCNLTVLDLSNNDICDLKAVLKALSTLPSLTGLQLAGNPCSVCAAYARTTITSLPRLQWLDSREVLPTDRPIESIETHPDDLRSAYFFVSVIRVMSVPQPPKPDPKGAVTAFHVEFELPLLDSTRRNFLMFRNNDSLIEMLPPAEDEECMTSKNSGLFMDSETAVGLETESHESDIYNRLTKKNSRKIFNFKIFESSRIQWNKVMNFPEPIRIFCPNLIALRDTFRSAITLRVIYSVTYQSKTTKLQKKIDLSPHPHGEKRVTLATIKCLLRNPDWSQPSQHFHWDDSLGTEEAIYWGDGDLSILQYPLTPGKTPIDPGPTKQPLPQNMTCHFKFGIETLRG